MYGEIVQTSNIGSAKVLKNGVYMLRILQLRIDVYYCIYSIIYYMGYFKFLKLIIKFLI